MHRRAFFLQSAAAGLLAAAGTQKSLRQTGAAKNLPVGSAISNAQLQNTEFTPVFAGECGIVVAENEMKWGPLRPAPDQFNFSRADALVEFAAAHKQLIRGHNLCWHQQLPKWFAGTATKSNAVDLLEKHIATVAGRYAGKIHSWDVVNEAIHVEDGRADGMRKSPWLELIGPDYLAVAFRAARRADPHAILTYNEYDIEQSGPAFEAKRRAVLNLLAKLRKDSVPVQALGLQSHLVARGAADEWTGLHHFIHEVEALDLKLFVTELDVDDRILPTDVTARDRAVGAIYGDYLTNVLQHRSVEAILTWGLTDRGTWLNGFKPRKDGLPQRPLPLDTNLQPKPAYVAMEAAIAAAESRALAQGG